MLNLEIFIVTYNRSSHLKNALSCLSNSILKEYNVTVLNNCSTDDTAKVVQQYQGDFKCLKIITHKNNVGACANIMRAFELSSANYTWVLCDDDDFNFGDLDDVINVVNEGRVNLIHTGAHPDISWLYGGMELTPKQLLEKGYHYFKASSFLPCNIFKTDKFQKNFLMAGFNNISNGYPHMPYIFDIYQQDSLVYFSKKQLVKAKAGQFYSAYQWFFWWLNTCKLLKNDSDVGLAFLDHFSKQEQGGLFYGMAEMSLKSAADRDIIFSFVRRYLKDDFGRLRSQMRNIERNRKLRQIKKFVKTLIGKK